MSRFVVHVRDTVRDFFKRPEVEDAVAMVVCALAAFIAARLGKKL